MAEKADESEVIPSSSSHSTGTGQSQFNFWILSRHEKYEYIIPQFPVLDIELVKVKYLIIEDDQQYRYDGFIRSDAVLDTIQFPFQVRMPQRGGFMLQVLL